MSGGSYLLPSWRTAKTRPIRDGFGDGLLRIGENENVIVLTADLAGSTKILPFAEAYPDRFFEVGVAEQNMAGIAAGLAFENFVPFMSSYAVFSPGRNWEQIRVSIALSNANVKIISSHGGLATGKNGPSHQALEDIALTRVLPHMTVLVPADTTQCAAAIEAAYLHSGPVYIRATRPDTAVFTQDIPFEIGKAYVYRQGKNVTVLACGIQVWDCLMVAEDLTQFGIECEVINVSSIKPLDGDTILASAQKTGRIVTVEDHQVAGGLGSAVAEFMSSVFPTPITRIGVDDIFGKSGDWQDLYRQYGLDRDSLRERLRKSVLDL